MLASIAVIALIGLTAGWAVVLLAAPRRMALRWPVVAPVLGLSVLCAIGLGFSRMGLPVSAYARWLLGALAAAGAGLTVAWWQKHPLLRPRRLLIYLLARGRRLALLAGIVSSVAAYLMTAHVRSDVRDVWGSGDFTAYWSVADYLIHHGADLDSYRAQSVFRSGDVFDHLTYHARLGCMVLVGELASIVDPSQVHRMINPLLVLCTGLLLWLGDVWLEQIRCRRFWPLLILSCHSFLYFCLYFSYLSQVIATVFTLLGLIALRLSTRPGGVAPALRREALTAALLFSGALLCHPTMAPFIACFAVALLVRDFTQAAPIRRWLRTAIAGAVLLLLVGHYLPDVWREMMALKNEPLPGWEWRRLIAFNEVAGIGKILGYHFPEPRTPLDWISDLAFGTFLCAGLGLAWRNRHNRFMLATLGGVTVAIAGATLAKVAQQVPNATHSYVKTISLFVLFFLLVGLAAAAEAIAGLPQRRALPWLALLLVCWMPLEWRALRTAQFQAPRYREPLIALSRRLVAHGEHLYFSRQLDLDLQKRTPLVRDVAYLDATLLPGSVVVATELPPGPAFTLVDRDGPYFAFRLTPGATWSDLP
ncbi:MAG: hypothetical protein HZA93_25385 [Verrucomicrobia bacterium]|nr:hypothetical protein [Verrucomicrobiota bacterium]